MIRKSFVLPLAAGILISTGIGAALSSTQDEKGGPLEKVMEDVQKHNAIITKGVRNAAFFKKNQKDVEKSAKELAKLAKQAKPVNYYHKNAKDEKEPAKKWGELLDALIKNCEKLGDVTAKPTATQPGAKAAFREVTKNCADCHLIFRVDDTKF